MTDFIYVDGVVGLEVEVWIYFWRGFTLSG